MPRPDLAVEALRKEDVNVICLQETTPEWEQVLRPALRDRYGHILFRHSPGAGGMAVFSKRPVKETAWVPSPYGWFPGWVLVTDTPLGTLQLLCVHLHPPVDNEGRFTIGSYLSTGHIRQDELGASFSRLDPAPPTLVLGDLNEGDGGEAVDWLKKRGFTDALPEFDRHGNTWEWTTSAGVRVAKRLDHILYSKHLRCLRAETRREGRSDHFPVVGVFENANFTTFSASASGSAVSRRSPPPPASASRPPRR
jgi:endonuclease/exonuclease/phosphatase (EEP) superfamily protein YafD